MLAERRRLLAVVIALITLMGGCERKPRAREREAVEAAEQARRIAREARQRAAQPLPEEPPFEGLRVPSSGLPCEVDEVFANKCRRCHGVPPRHAAPLVFLTWEDTRSDRFGQPLYSVIGRAVRTDFMPYKIEANPPVLPLSAEEKRIILDWVERGAPRGDCGATPSPSASVQSPATKPAPSR